MIHFQHRVWQWLSRMFDQALVTDPKQRSQRFLEEAIELVQSVDGMTAQEAHGLVDYVFNRPKGEPTQEVGGVMISLAGFCTQFKIDMQEAGETELARASDPAIEERIRAKQRAKPVRLDQCYTPSSDELRLRRLLCGTFEHMPYMDDGEAQGQDLDWLRCSVAEIEARIYWINKDRFEELSKKKECPTCKAPCDTKINSRGGEHGWGTSDEERTTYSFAPIGLARSVLKPTKE